MQVICITPCCFLGSGFRRKYTRSRNSICGLDALRLWELGGVLGRPPGSEPRVATAESTRARSALCVTTEQLPSPAKTMRSRAVLVLIYAERRLRR